MDLRMTARMTARMMAMTIEMTVSSSVYLMPSSTFSLNRYFQTTFHSKRGLVTKACTQHRGEERDDDGRHDRTRTLDRQGFNAIGNIEAVAVDLFLRHDAVSLFLSI